MGVMMDSGARKMSTKTAFPNVRGPETCGGLFDRTVWSIKLKFYVPSQHNIGHFSLQRRSSKPISWLSTEKLIQMQQKQTCICNKI